MTTDKMSQGKIYGDRLIADKMTGDMIEGKMTIKICMEAKGQQKND